MSNSSLSFTVRRIIRWIRCRTTHRYRVTASWEFLDEYHNDAALKAWISSAPDGHIFWTEQPYYLDWDLSKPWITHYNWAFRRREDALLHQLRCPR